MVGRERSFVHDSTIVNKSPFPSNQMFLDVRVLERGSHFVHFWTTGVWECETGQNVQLLNSAGEIVNIYEYAIQLFISLFYHLFILLFFYFFINLCMHSFIYVSICFHLGIYFTRSVLSSSFHFSPHSFFSRLPACSWGELDQIGD